MSRSSAEDDEGSEVKEGAAIVEYADHKSENVIIPPKPTTPPISSPPLESTMPGLANLILHSPSANIVGTPFALDIDIPRFEYPFPETSLSATLAIPALSHSLSSGSGSSSSTSCTSSASPSPYSISPSNPPSHQHQHPHVHIVSRRPTHPIHIGHPNHHQSHSITSQSPPGSAFPLSLTSTSSTSHSSHSHLHSHSYRSHSPSPQHTYSSNATTLLVESDRDKEPPIPPGLLKKKHRWSLGLLGASNQRPRDRDQRRSATTIDHTNNNNDDINASGTDYFDVSPGSTTSSSSSAAGDITSDIASDTLSDTASNTGGDGINASPGSTPMVSPEGTLVDDPFEPGERGKPGGGEGVEEEDAMTPKGKVVR